MADPTNTPALSYQNSRAALDFLRDAFGFELDMLIEDEAGKLVHSQMLHGDGRIMVGTEWTDDNKSPQSIGGKCTQTVHSHLKEDIDAHCQSARAAGADILAEPQAQSYGDRTYRARSRGSYLDVLTDYRGADAGRMGQECRRAQEMDAREGFMAPAAFAKLARVMPEAEASEHFGTPDDRVCGKIFATAGRVDGRAALKLTPDRQAMLCEAEPELFEPIAGGWDRKGWTNLILAKADAKTAKSAIWMAWRNTAPKKLLKAHAA